MYCSGLTSLPVEATMYYLVQVKAPTRMRDPELAMKPLPPTYTTSPECQYTFPPYCQQCNASASATMDRLILPSPQNTDKQFIL